jgi:hypothetical protein
VDASGCGCCGCIFTFDLCCSENANRTSAGGNWPGRRHESACTNRGVKQRARDPNFAGEIAGEGEVIAGIGYDLNDRPESGIGTDGKTNFGGPTSDPRLGGLTASAVGNKSDDEEDCKEESSDHEHHEAKS